MNPENVFQSEVSLPWKLWSQQERFRNWERDWEALRYGKHCYAGYLARDTGNYVGRHRIWNTVGFFIRIVRVADGRFMDFKRTSGGR